MKIIRLTIGETKEIDACFAEVLLSENDEHFYTFAITNGELTLLVRSDASLSELLEKIKESGDEDAIVYDYDVVSWDAQNNQVCREITALDLESVLAHCMESDLENYQCWNNDGNEGLYEASESDSGLAFVIAYDLLAKNDFENVRAMVEDDEGAAFLLSILDEANLDDKDDLTIDW